MEIEIETKDGDGGGKALRDSWSFFESVVFVSDQQKQRGVIRGACLSRAHRVGRQ